MASKRFEIDMGLNASDVARGANDAKRSLEKLEDAVADTSKGGARDLDALEDELKDVQKGAERAGRELDDMGTNSKRSFADASDNVRGFKDEAVQNFSEVASSFNGDMQDMADGVQGLTGGLASSLTPGIGIPIAIIGAIAGSFLQSWITAAEDSEQRIDDMYAAMTDAGSRFLSNDYFNKALADLDTSKIEEAQQKAIDLGVEERDVLRAMVGDREAIGRILATQQQHYQEELQGIRDSGKSLEEQAVAIDAVNTKYGEQNDFLRDIQRDTSTAADLWEALNGAMEKTPDAVSAAQGAVAQFRQVMRDGVVVPLRVDDSALRNYKPATVYIPGQIVRPGTRQLL